MVAVSVQNLSKNYRVYRKSPGLIGALRSLVKREFYQVRAVEKVSFSIASGELVGFIGPNGAGKTTTLKCLAGLLYPDGGEVSVLGFQPLERRDEFLSQIGLVMGQKNQLWWDLPPTDTFLLNKEIYAISDEQYRKTLQELSLLLGMQPLLAVPVRKLSLGERMKAELIAALLHRPKVLFLDEPTIGLDVVMQKTVRDFIKEYNQSYQATVLLTSHYMEDVQELCKRVIVIDEGKILYDGELSNLVKRYADYKLITVEFAERVDERNLTKYGRLQEYSFPRAVLSVERTQSNKIAAKILRELNVEDLNVQDPDIEDIIRDVFQNKDH